MKSHKVDTFINILYPLTFIVQERKREKGTWNIGEIVKSNDLESNFHGKRLLLCTQKVNFSFIKVDFFFIVF